MKNALARLEALEHCAPADKLLIVTEVQTPEGARYRLPKGKELLPLREVYAYMRLHGQGVLLIDDLPPLPKEKHTCLNQNID